MPSGHVYTKEEFIAYGNRLHYNTVIDIIVNSFAAFIVLKHSTKAMGYYKYYILLTIFCAFLMDFHISFIFGPFMMLPSTILCGAGFVCKHFGYIWGQYIQYGIMHITISSVGCSLVAGFFYQLSSLNGNVDFFHSVKGVVIIILIMICYPLPSFAILPFPEDKEITATYIKKDFNNSYDLFISTPSCHALILDFRGKAHYGALALQVSLVLVVASIVALKILRKLAGMKNMLSSATLKARRQLLIALCFQMTIPSMLIVFPLVLILISIIVEAKYINTISDIAMPVIALHSLVNACSVMYIITPYRKAIKNYGRKFFRVKESPSTILIESSTKSHTVASKVLYSKNLR